MQLQLKCHYQQHYCLCDKVIETGNLTVDYFKDYCVGHQLRTMLIGIYLFDHWLAGCGPGKET